MIRIILITFLISLASSFFARSVSYSMGGPGTKDTIKIGLLLQDKNSRAAKRGAEMAIEKANLNNSNKYFMLSVRDMEGPWGTGSRVTVDLVFKEKVRAIIGSVNGRNSHLAEQVSAKTRVPFLSAWSGDPTLAYAFIPWYFCCVPDDRQKAEAITGHISPSASSGIALVSARDYDSKISSEYFIKTSKEKGITKPLFLSFDKTSLFDSISNAIGAHAIKNIVFCGSLSAFKEFRKHIATDKYIISILSYTDGESSIKANEFEDIEIISPGYYFTAEGNTFIDEFRNTYGILPGDAAAYAYDMTRALVSSIMVSPDSPDSLKNYLSKTDFNGITGKISFDKRGSLERKVELMTVKKGKFVKDKN